jgi:biotin carboxylase
MSHLMFIDASRFNVDALARAVAKGHQVTFVETDAFRSRYSHPSMQEALALATHRLVVKGSIDDDGAQDAVAAFHAASPVDGLLTTIDANTTGTARLAHRLGVRATSLEGVTVAKNKAATREALARAGLANCKHATAIGADGIRCAAASLSFPMVAKPVQGYGKLLTRTLHDASELEAFVHQYETLRGDLAAVDRDHVSEEMILEEFLDGAMYSVEIGVDEHGVYPFMVTQRRRPEYNLLLELGSSMPAAVPEDLGAAISDYAQQVVAVLGLDIGIFHLEVIATARGPVLIEANARLMGGALPMLYGRATDDSIFDHLVDIHAGQPVRWSPRSAPRVATARQIAPVSGGRALQDVGAAFLREHCPWIAAGSVDVRRGQEIRPMTCNFDSLGYFHVVAESHEDSIQLAERGLACLEEAIGVVLAR